MKPVVLQGDRAFVHIRMPSRKCWRSHRVSGGLGRIKNYPAQCPEQPERWMDGLKWQKPAGKWAFWVEGLAYAKAGDQQVLLMAEAQGTRKEGGWNGRKREVEIRSQPSHYLLVCINSCQSQ